MFPAVFSCFQLFSAVFSCFQLFSAVFSCFLLFSAVFSCFQLFFLYILLFLAVFSCFLLFSAVFFFTFCCFQQFLIRPSLKFFRCFLLFCHFLSHFAVRYFFLPPHLDVFLCFLPSLLVSAILLFFCLSSLMFRFFYSSVFNIVKFSILSSYLISLPHVKRRSAAATPLREMRPPTRSSPGQPKGHFYYIRRKSCSASPSDARGSNDINK